VLWLPFWQSGRFGRFSAVVGLWLMRARGERGKLHVGDFGWFFAQKTSRPIGNPP